MNVLNAQRLNGNANEIRKMIKCILSNLKYAQRSRVRLRLRLRVKLRVKDGDSVDIDWRIVQNRMSLAASLKMALRNHCSKNQRGVKSKFRAFFVSLQLHT